LYIRDASSFLDARILLCTFLRMIGVRHGRAVHLLGLEREVELAADHGRRFVEDSSHPAHSPMHHSSGSPVMHTNRDVVGALASESSTPACSVGLTEVAG